MKRLAATVLATMLLEPLAAQARNPDDFYATASVAQWDVHRNGSDALRPSAAMLTLGKYVGDFLAIEASGGTGISGDSTSTGGTRVAADAKEFAAFHVRPFMRVAGDGIEYFSRFGVFHGRLGGRCACSNASGPRDDISFGLGVAFLLSRSTAVVVDGMQYYAKNDHTIRAVNVGLRVGF